MGLLAPLATAGGGGRPRLSPAPRTSSRPLGGAEALLEEDMKNTLSFLGSHSFQLAQPANITDTHTHTPHPFFSPLAVSPFISTRLVPVSDSVLMLLNCVERRNACADPLLGYAGHDEGASVRSTSTWKWAAPASFPVACFWGFYFFCLFFSFAIQMIFLLCGGH